MSFLQQPRESQEIGVEWLSSVGYLSLAKTRSYGWSTDECLIGTADDGPSWTSPAALSLEVARLCRERHFGQARIAISTTRLNCLRVCLRVAPPKDCTASPWQTVYT